MPPIRLQINGEIRRYDGAPTVEELLRDLGMVRGAVAVEVNGEIVPRSRHASHRLDHEDRLEIVTLVGGG